MFGSFVATLHTVGPGLGEGYSLFLGKTYTSTDVLLCDPHTTDVLDVLYHVV